MYIIFHRENVTKQDTFIINDVICTLCPQIHFIGDLIIVIVDKVKEIIKTKIKKITLDYKTYSVLICFLKILQVHHASFKVPGNKVLHNIMELKF